MSEEILGKSKKDHEEVAMGSTKSEKLEDVKNEDNYSSIIDTDAGPIFTQEWDKINPDQKKKLRASISNPSLNMMKYNVFVPGNESYSFHKKNEMVRISIDKQGTWTCKNIKQSRDITENNKDFEEVAVGSTSGTILMEDVD